jgi:hypothetical protein
MGGCMDIEQARCSFYGVSLLRIADLKETVNLQCDITAWICYNHHLDIDTEVLKYGVYGNK